MNTNDGNGDENNDDNDYGNGDKNYDDNDDGNGDEYNDDNGDGNDDDTRAMVPKNLTLPVWCDLKNV